MDAITQMNDETAVKSTELDTAFNVFLPPDSSGVRLSRDIVEFLKDRHESPHDVLTRPIVRAPEVDDSLPLSHYYISTSHNTYLLAYQLFGTADASIYTHVLKRSCRCVEIDVWSSSHGPIVTHGWTLSSHIPFRDVCVAIGKAVHPDDWPVVVSLECHVDVDKQDEIVHIMKQAWGERLVDKEIVPRNEQVGISPGELKGRIVLLVEYHHPKSPSDAHVDANDNNSDMVMDVDPKGTPGERKISPELAALGVYGRSIKPHKGWLTNAEVTEPRHIVYNLSEASLGKLLPESIHLLIANSALYLRRVYPEGSRITSTNLVPLPFWRSGTQIAALNWQRYDRGLQFNEALFVGSGGWVCKPYRLRGIKPSDETKYVRLTCEVFGGCNIPGPSHGMKVYIYAELFSSSGDKTWESQARHASPFPEPHVPTADVLWNEKFHWDYPEDDLAFLRLRVYREEWGKDDYFGTFCARIDHLQEGWRFVRLFNKTGKHNKGLLLVKFTYV